MYPAYGSRNNFAEGKVLERALHPGLEELIEQFERGGIVWLRARGKSMLPFLKDGEFIIARGCKVDNVKIGDICVILQGRKLRIHRVIWRRGGVIFTKGDSLGSIGRFCEKRDGRFLGKIEGILRKGKIKRLRRAPEVFKLLFSILLLPWQFLRGH